MEMWGLCYGGNSDAETANFWNFFQNCVYMRYPQCMSTWCVLTVRQTLIRCTVAERFPKRKDYYCM